MPDPHSAGPATASAEAAARGLWCRQGALALLAWLLVACAPDEAALAARAQAALLAADPAAAERESRRLLQAHAESALGRLLLGQALLARGELLDAGLEIDRAQALGAPAEQLAPVQVRLWLEQRRPLEVIRRHAGTGLADAQAMTELKTALAQAYLQTTEIDKGLVAVGEALQLHPGHGPALVLRARLYAAHGQPVRSRISVDDVLLKRPDDASAWVLKGDLAGAEPGGEAAAIAAYRRATELQPGLAAAHVGAITALQRSGDADAMRQQLAGMAAVLPQHPDSLFLQALQAHADGDSARARETLQHLLRRRGEQVELLFLAALVEQRLGDPAAATALLAKVRRLAPDAAEPRRALAALRLVLGQTEAAQAQIDALLRADPDDAAAHGLLAGLRVLGGDFAGAEAAFARAWQQRYTEVSPRGTKGLPSGSLAPGRREMQAAARAAAGPGAGDLAQLAQLAALAGRGETGEALRRVDELARAQPAASLPLLLPRPMPSLAPALLRGHVLLAAGDEAAAAQAYAAALDQAPAELPALRALTRLDVEAGRLALARQRLVAALPRHAASAHAMLALAALARQAGAGREQSTAWIDQALRADASDEEVWLLAIRLHRDDGDAAAAWARAEAADQALPGSPLLLPVLAELHAERGEPAQALAAWQRLAQLQPATPQLHDALAQAHAQLGQPAQAIEHQLKALTLAPQDGTMRLKLARHYLAAARKDRAREALRRLITPGVPPALRTEAESLLRQIGA